jgi:hypothetical protein
MAKVSTSFTPLQGEGAVTSSSEQGSLGLSICLDVITGGDLLPYSTPLRSSWVVVG